ncbi:MAG: membrane protein insertion efficiency factor YidD [Candidatus Cloacimonetes bacterium]|nr:membrane protein insertion efficiency factor YidD [Candidatus Cloacimonadota bacterium]MDY0298675.1 membrane protein insertion efficiency factor YidD [Candidatus Cloacimonadaceae bacterium]MCB5279718.1 membrane protein insertion efficiency factor YidD [Candidatus Cloacimonadota bacterium]MCK9333096.1 membrane protein insertion efficiency factor YidD [Candidatus Cloacimonadota bacterium]MDD2210642.1 membrane protein insertion efficiency factor YidD [Candidatus Cloacimonadota bacterium]
MLIKLHFIVSIPAQLIMMLIRFYQLSISPFLPKTCRFTPTCSTYALQAYQRYNLLKATYLSSWRILRCNPFCKGGYDPLP